MSYDNPCYRSFGNCILSKNGERLVAGCQNSTITSRVKHIGKHAFSFCTGLEDIRIPKSVESIGDYAFIGCSALTDFHIPAGVTSIGEGILLDCTALESINVSPDNSCFRSFNNCLLSIDGKKLIGSCGIPVIPEGVETIGAYSFSGFTGLRNLRIPDGVVEIREGAFENCTDLESIVIPDSVERIGEYAFSGCTSLTGIRIPDGVVEIREGAFENCTDLESIVIPDSVERIGEYAFSGCTSLTGIRIPDSVEYIGEDAFLGCSSLTGIKLPNGMTYINVWYILPCCNNLRSIEFPENVTDIKLVFSDYPALESISVSPDNPYYKSFANCLLSKDGKRLVAGCRTPVIPEGVEIIGERAFSGLSELDDIHFPDSVKEIEDFAFEKCSGLKRITIGTNVTHIGEHAFSDCSALESISVSPDNPCYRSIGNCLLSRDGTQLMVGSNTSTIPGTVTHIWEGAFKGRSGLKCISIPQDVTSIDDMAFSGCTSLAGIYFPARVTSIGKYVLAGCSALRSISVSSENPVYSASGNCLLSKDGKELISGCRTSSIPDGVESIADKAFWGQTGLFHIVIPSSVRRIGKIAFMGCRNLSEVWITDRLDVVGGWAFAKCPNLEEVIVEPGPFPHEVDMEKVMGLFSRSFPSGKRPDFLQAADRPTKTR